MPKLRGKNKKVNILLLSIFFEKMPKRKKQKKLFGPPGQEPKYDPISLSQRLWPLIKLREERGLAWLEQAKRHAAQTISERKGIKLKRKTEIRMAKSLLKHHQNLFRELKKRIPAQLLNEKCRSIARTKLKNLHTGIPLTQEQARKIGFGPIYKHEQEYYKSKKQMEFIPQRFETSGRVNTQLSRKDLFAGEEAMIAESPFQTIKLLKLVEKEGHFVISPISVFDQIIRKTGYTMMEFRDRPYNCRVFFDKTAFRHSPGANEFWGYIEKFDYIPVIGIQLFDPNPRALLDFAKAMAKRRPHDPIPIIDLYGNVFYP